MLLCQDIRRQVKRVSGSFSWEQKQAWSWAITGRFFESFTRLQGIRLGLYRSLSDEVQTDFLAQILKSHGSYLYYPRIVSEGLEFFPEQGIWEKNEYGIDEPMATQPILPEFLDLLIVPCVALGVHGERLGRGKGYYDRFLPKVSCFCLSLGFDFQIFPALPQSPKDQRIDWILTPTREYPARIVIETKIF